MRSAFDTGQDQPRGLRPEEIEARSMQIIASLLSPDCCRPDELPVVMRLVHTAGDPTVADVIRFHPDAVVTGKEALLRGADVITDTQMVRLGIDCRRLARLGGECLCLISDDRVVEEARCTGRTRAATAMQALSKSLDGAVVALGNAPTALREVLAMARDRVARPALVVGMPVGFVDAAQSKSALMDSDLVWISIEGTRGGSPLAAATINALLRMVEER